jgi:hypothetical protein
LWSALIERVADMAISRRRFHSGAVTGGVVAGLGMVTGCGDPSTAAPTAGGSMLSKATKDRSALIHLAAAQGAQLHDQPSGPQVADEFIVDWLDDQLR